MDRKPPVTRIVDALQRDGFRFEEVRSDAGCFMPWHDHPATYLDLYLAGASQASWHDSVHAYTVSVLRAGERHRSVCLTNTHTFQTIVPESWIESLDGPLRVEGGLSVCDSGQLTHIATGMYRRFAQRDDLTSLDLQGLLFDFWAAGPVRFETKGCPWLRQAEEYLRAHAAKTVSPAEVAAAVGIHPAHLMRAFRTSYRCTMGDYLRSLRVQRACSLLRSTRMTFAEIAYEVGFADQSHLNRTFRRQLGTTPSAYLREVGRNQPLLSAGIPTQNELTPPPI